ncbi:hypothetical protein LXL04_006285 [Taraxacum kok-saghyz]
MSSNLFSLPKPKKKKRPQKLKSRQPHQTLLIADLSPPLIAANRRSSATLLAGVSGAIPPPSRRLQQRFIPFKPLISAADFTEFLYKHRILSEALADRHAPFPFPPPDKYYLCDAAYSHVRGFMAPYRNVRYWLGDFRQRRALTNKEKFNHAHAKLRNVIECAFGVLKARFPILKKMAPFPLVTQRNIVVAYEVQLNGTAADREFMTQLRDEIAEQLMQNVKKQTVFFLQTADVWSTSSAAEACRVADVVRKLQMFWLRKNKRHLSFSLQISSPHLQ